MVQQFHDDIQARVQNDKEYSELFPVTKGSNRAVQDDVFLSAMPTDAFQDCGASFPTKYTALMAT